MKAVRFLLSVTFYAVVFGIALDLVTAHVAVEYFTVHHPHVVDSDSPVVMALVWGFGASWWFGLLAGSIVWWFRWRVRRPVDPALILGWIRRYLVRMWLAMMAILAASYGLVGLVPQPKQGAGFEQDRRLVAVAVTHATEYVLGALVLVLVLRRIEREPGSPEPLSPDPPGKP